MDSPTPPQPTSGKSLLSFALTIAAGIFIVCALFAGGLAIYSSGGIEPDIEPLAQIPASNSSSKAATSSQMMIASSSARSVAAESSSSLPPDEPAVPFPFPEDFPRIDGATERTATKIVERGMLRYEGGWSSPRGISDISTEFTRKLNELGWERIGSNAYGGAVNYYSRPIADTDTVEYAVVGYGYGDNVTNFFVQLFPTYPAAALSLNRL